MELPLVKDGWHVTFLIDKTVAKCEQYGDLIKQKQTTAWNKFQYSCYECASANMTMDCTLMAGKDTATDAQARAKAAKAAQAQAQAKEGIEKLSLEEIAEMRGQ